MTATTRSGGSRSAASRTSPTTRTARAAAENLTLDFEAAGNVKRVGNHRRAQPSGLVQFQALTARTLWTMIRKGELLVAVVAPLVFTVGFYLPLKFVMQLQGINYAQFLMPIIVLQAMAFTAISAAQRASSEALTGFTTRLQTMPVVGGVPLLSRVSSGIVRSVVSLAAALFYGYVIGFRFSAGIGQAALFCAMALAISTTLSIGADAIGTMSKSPEATSQALTLPQLILGMASSGFVPETGFPEWIRPFVRNQPISQFSATMRDMAQGGVSWHVFWPSGIWIIGLVAVFVPFAIWASSRRS